MSRFLSYVRIVDFDQNIRISGRIFTMSKKKISQGVVHSLPTYMYVNIVANDDLWTMWEDITPLARNEWICWVTSAKKEETKERRMRIMNNKLLLGERRPCCFAGCIHR